MRRLLRIPEGPPSADEASAHRIFSASILLSGLRCLLGYVVLPILSPAARGGGRRRAGDRASGRPYRPCLRRAGDPAVLLANHRWRWPITALYSVVIVLVTTLVVADVVHLVGK